MERERKRAEGNSKKHKWTSFEKWYFAGQSLLLIATASAFGAAYWYAGIADIEKNVMVYQQTPEIIKSADAARSAAHTAQKTLTQSAYSSQIDQRAWVSVLDISVEKPDPLSIKIVFMNTGKTPARKFVIAAGGDIGVEKGHERRLSGSGVIAPGGKYSSFVAGNSSLAQSPKLAIHGRIDYVSIFGGEHWTTFCYHLIPGNTETPNGFSPCESGNETDNNTVQ